MKRVLGSLLVTLCCSCRSVAPTPPMLTVQTELALYQPGDTATVRFSNVGSAPLEYNGCAVQLMLFDGAGWKAVAGANEGTVCAAPLFILGPGDTQTARVLLSAGLGAGAYRIVCGAAYTNGGRSLLPEDQRTSNPFRIS